MTEILLKVTLNTHKPTEQNHNSREIKNGDHICRRDYYLLFYILGKLNCKLKPPPFYLS